MASGSKRRNAQAEQSYATNQRVVDAQLQPSQGETDLGKSSHDVMNYKGDYAGLPGLAMPTFYSRLKGEQAQQNRGAATFGAQNADPNLLAGLNANEEANASQMDALAFQDAVGTRQNQARQDAATSAGLQGSRLGTLGSQTAGTSANAQSLAAQPGFWTQFLFQTMQNASQIAAASAGKPPSDRRLKTDIQSLTNALEKLETINGVSFKWNEDSIPYGHFPEQPDIGVIAQDVERVFPELISTGISGHKTVNYNGLVGVLFAAVKELSAKVKEMEKLKARSAEA